MPPPNSPYPQLSPYPQTNLVIGHGPYDNLNNPTGLNPSAMGMTDNPVPGGYGVNPSLNFGNLPPIDNKYMANPDDKQQ
jgi:hypothetical protein